jgi:hypothetical protein
MSKKHKPSPEPDVKPGNTAPSGPPVNPFPQPQPTPAVEEPEQKEPTREEFEDWKNGPEGQGHARGRD